MRKSPAGNLRKVGDGLAAAFENDAAFPADHPFGEFALRGAGMSGEPSNQKVMQKT